MIGIDFLVSYKSATPLYPELGLSLELLPVRSKLATWDFSNYMNNERFSCCLKKRKWQFLLLINTFCLQGTFPLILARRNCDEVPSNGTGGSS